MSPKKLIGYLRDITTTAVSRGGVLRALNKESGPRRRLRLNLGVCLSEPYDESFKGHSQAPYVKNPLNGKRYVEDCMDWVIRKVSLELSRLLSSRTCSVIKSQVGPDPQRGEVCGDMPASYISTRPGDDRL